MEEEEALAQDEAVTQSRYREIEARKQFEARFEYQIMKLDEDETAATRIQAMHRRPMARRELDALMEEQEGDSKEDSDEDDDPNVRNGFPALHLRNFRGNTSALRGGAVCALYDTLSTRVRLFTILGLLFCKTTR